MWKDMRFEKRPKVSPENAYVDFFEDFSNIEIELVKPPSLWISQSTVVYMGTNFKFNKTTWPSIIDSRDHLAVRFGRLEVSS